MTRYAHGRNLVGLVLWSSVFKCLVDKLLRLRIRGLEVRVLRGAPFKPLKILKKFSIAPPCTPILQSAIKCSFKHQNATTTGRICGRIGYSLFGIFLAEITAFQILKFYKISSKNTTGLTAGSWGAHGETIYGYRTL